MDSPNEEKAVNTGILKNEVCRSWYEDGMFEIGVGVLFLFIALGLYLGSRFGLPAHFNLIVKLLWSAAYIGLGFGTFWLVRKLKEKFVWRKVGYSVIKDYYPKSVWVVLSLIFLFVVFAMFSIRFLSNEITIFLFGLVITFAFVAEYIQAGKIKRFLFFSFLSILIAGVSSLLGITWRDSIFLMVYVLGCALLISGVIVYMNFRRKLTE